ncbi:MAG: DPP IV N-terminal domain-containing protein, partial [Acidobacteriota bacterium]
MSERGDEAPRSLTAADYAQAEKFMPYNVTPLVLRAGVRPTWLPRDRFWYRNALENEGSEFILVDPKRGTRAPAFDHAKIAAALSAATGKTYDANHLPFTTFDLSADGKTISFTAESRRWLCDLKGKSLKPIEGGEAAPPEKRRGEGRRFGAEELPEVLSPDGLFAAFIRDHNLWVREISTKTVRQLTTDGLKEYGY